MTCVARMAACTEKLTKEKHRRKRQTPGRALKASLQQAAAQKRLTVGLSNCVSKLKRNPESVMVCLVLQGSASSRNVPDKAASNIQHTLLQAFCTESRINMVRVVASATLIHLVRRLAGKIKKEESGDNFQEDPSDSNLLIIQYPAGGPSAEDELWTSACQGGHLDIWTTGHLPSD